MKIGLITFHRAENYGAALQCRALYTYLSVLGNSVEIIDYKQESMEKSYRIFPIFRRNIFILGLQYISTILNYRRWKERKEKFQNFLADVHKTQVMTMNEICQAYFDYDLIITGSDQVWNPDVTGGFDKVYFLTFGGTFRRVGYAISMGDVNNELFAEKTFSAYAKRFDALSFREPDAAALVSQKLKKNFPHVLDPTLLLTQSQWDDIIGTTSVDVPHAYVFVYYAMEGQSAREIHKIADYISKRYNIPIVFLKMSKSPTIFKRKVITILDAGPREFLYLIKHATFVVTSSFHGTALSCVYQKDLNIVLPEKRSARIKTIADMFHLKDRVYSSYEDFIERCNDEKPPINNGTSEYQEALKRSVKYLHEITNVD